MENIIIYIEYWEQSSLWNYHKWQTIVVSLPSTWAFALCGSRSLNIFWVRASGNRLDTKSSGCTYERTRTAAGQSVKLRDQLWNLPTNLAKCTGKKHTNKNIIGKTIVSIDFITIYSENKSQRRNELLLHQHRQTHALKCCLLCPKNREVINRTTPLREQPAHKSPDLFPHWLRGLGDNECMQKQKVDFSWRLQTKLTSDLSTVMIST